MLSRNNLIIICGLSFAGKTTLGHAIAKRFAYEEVDVDEVKDRLFGAGMKDDALNDEDWKRLYRETDKQIETLLRVGKTVIDASRNFSKSERASAKQIAAKANAGLATIFVDTPEHVVRRRWLENRRHPTRHDVSDEGFEAIIHAMEPPAADENPLIFSDGNAINDWIANILTPVIVS